MKRAILTALAIVLCCIVYSQSDNTIRAEFIGLGVSTYYAGEQHYQQLDSIHVTNNSRGWQSTIVYPDTVLVSVYHGTGSVFDNTYDDAGLLQNIPNPFNGETSVELSVGQVCRVELSVFDMQGKLYAQYVENIQSGRYIFSIRATTPQTYLLSANVGGKQQSIKMVNMGDGGENAIRNLGCIGQKLTIGYTTYNGDVYESHRIDTVWRNGTYTLYFDIPYCNDKTTVLRIQDCVPFSYNGQTYSESGRYVLENLQSVCGADSVVELDFRIGGQIETEFFIETNDGEYQWGDTLLRDSGTYRRQFTSEHGCDSIVTLFLTLYVNERTISCRFSGIGISAIDEIERHYQRLDSISITKERNHLQWMMHYPDTTLTTVTIQDKLTVVNGNGEYYDDIIIKGYTTFRGEVYESMEIRDIMHLNMDSVLYFHIPYCNDKIMVYEIQDCEPYTYHGQTYSESGHYILEEFETVLGCDSIVELDLRIRDHILIETEVYTCDETYQLEDTLITESGTYQWHYTSVHGCDSAVSYIISLGNGFTDERDGNTYCTVKIGDQVWMAENLRYLPYVNSLSETAETFSDNWAADTVRCFVYGYDGTDVNEAKMTDNYLKYGVLYNLPILFIAPLGHESDTICPAGWHIPSDSEWSRMEVFLENNGYNFDDYFDSDDDRNTHNVIAKSLAYTSDWTISNELNTVGWLQMKNNASHFSGMPGGWANIQTGVYNGIHDLGSWWTSSISNDGSNFFDFPYCIRILRFNLVNSSQEFASIRKSALSVRCVRDE